jgi:hypothetical protein
LVSRETDSSKNIFFYILNHPELRIRYQKVAELQETAERCGIAEVKF